MSEIKYSDHTNTQKETFLTPLALTQEGLREEVSRLAQARPAAPWEDLGRAQEAQRSCFWTSCCHGGPSLGWRLQVAMERELCRHLSARRGCPRILTRPGPLAGQPGGQTVPSSQWTRGGHSIKEQESELAASQYPSCVQPRASGLRPPLRDSTVCTPGRSIRDLISLRTPLEVATGSQGAWGWDHEGRGCVRRPQWYHCPSGPQCAGL